MEGNNSLIIVAIIAAFPPTLMALLTLLHSKKNERAIENIHISINSRMDELLKTARGEATLEGREIERVSQQK